MVWFQAEGEAQKVKTQQNMVYFDQISFDQIRIHDWQSHCVRSSHLGDGGVQRCQRISHLHPTRMMSINKLYAREGVEVHTVSAAPFHIVPVSEH